MIAVGGPVGWGQWVVDSFHVPLGHLPFDEPGVGPESSNRVQAPTEQDEGVGPAVVSVHRGKPRACESERRVIRRAATKETRSGSTSA